MDSILFAVWAAGAMRFNYQFSNLCGTVYRQGNVLFTPDGNSLVSPVGNRVSVFDLVNNRSHTLPVETRRDIARLALSPNAALLLAVDEGARPCSLSCTGRLNTRLQ